MNLEKAFLEGDIVSPTLLRLWWVANSKTPDNILARFRIVRIIRMSFLIFWSFFIGAFAASKSDGSAAMVFIGGAIFFLVILIPLLNSWRTDLRFVEDCRRLKSLTLPFTPAELCEDALKKIVFQRLQDLTKELSCLKKKWQSEQDTNTRIGWREAIDQVLVVRDDLYTVASRFGLVFPDEDCFLRFLPASPTLVEAIPSPV